jgi:hypothetical protein
MLRMNLWMLDIVNRVKAFITILAFFMIKWRECMQ